MNKTYCDKCKKEINVINHCKAKSVVFGGEKVELDLCENCINSLIVIIKNFK